MSFQRGWGEERPVGMAGLVYDAQRRRARRRAVNLFAFGFMAGALASCGAGMALGETIEIGGIGYMGNKITPGSTVTITPSDKPGEWAIVVFENRLVNDGLDTGEYALSFEDVVIPTLFLWEADPLLGSDRITVLPPDGIICEPESCEATVQEGAVGRIVLIDWRGM